MKKLKWIVLALVAVIVVALGIVWMNLNGIVRRTVETQASSSLDLKTTLAAAHVSIFGGSLGLDDLKIASPPGFSAEHMLALDKAGVKVSLGELRGDPIRIHLVQIDAPSVVIEAKGSKLNFQAIMDQQSKTPADPKSGAPAEPIKLIIDELNVTNPKISLRPGLGDLKISGLKEEYLLTLPSISLKGIGTGEGNQNGVAIKEVVAQLLATLAAKAADSEELPPELRQLLHLNAQQVAQQLGKRASEELNKQIGQLGNKIGGDVGKVVDEQLKNQEAGKAVEKGVGDLLGGKDKKTSGKKKATTRP